MIPSSQIRAARQLLGWKGTDLAAKSGIGITTLRRYELQKGIPSANVANLKQIKLACESAGIEFLGDPEINPGVMLHLKKS